MPDRTDAEREGETRMEAILTTRSAEELRQVVKDQLDLQSGEAVLSIGCGPGFEPAVLAEDVGERGRVYGIDVDEETLASAKDRCADLPQVTFEQGDATDLPVPDESYDAAVAKQVYQFVPDIETAVSELRRVLRPGGRAAVVEKDVDARVIHSSDRDRMKRVEEAYLDICPNPNLGSRLTSYLNTEGLTVEHIEPFPILHREIDERIAAAIDVYQELLEADESFDQSEIEAWEQDLRDLDEAGEFLSCGTQFIYLVRKSE